MTMTQCLTVASLLFTLLQPAASFTTLTTVTRVHSNNHALFATSVSRKPFIAGNWKLNPSSKQQAIELASGIAAAAGDTSQCDVAIFVPFPYLPSVQNTVDGKLIVGAQVRNLVGSRDPLPLNKRKLLSSHSPPCFRSFRHCLLSGKTRIISQIVVVGKNSGNHSSRSGCIYRWSFRWDAPIHGY